MALRMSLPIASKYASLLDDVAAALYKSHEGGEDMKRGTTTQDEAELLDIPAAAKLLGMSEAAVRQAVVRDQLPARRFGKMRVVFLRHELKHFIRNLPPHSAPAA
jgi:hypothetical protein